MDKEQAREKFRLADKLFNDQQYGPALKVLTELNSAFPNERHVLYPMARCLTALGRNGEALDLADRIVRQFDYAPATDLYKRLSSLKRGDGLAGLEAGSDPALALKVPSLDSDPVVDLPPGVMTLDSDPVMPPPGMPKFDSDPPPLPKDLDSLVSKPFDAQSGGPAPVTQRGDSRRAVMFWVGLTIFGFLAYFTIIAVAGGPLHEFERRLEENPSFIEESDNPIAEFPWSSLGIFILAGFVCWFPLTCFPGYWSLRVLDALPANDFGEDMKDIALYTLFGLLLLPVLFIGWIIYLVILAKHYQLSFGKLVGVVGLWIVFDVLISIPVSIAVQVVTNLVLG